MSDDSRSATLDEAIEAFNRGEYFRAAERFELAGQSATAELKDFIGALNRIAAAMHLRFERGGRQSSINLLSQAMLALHDMKPVRAGIDVQRLCPQPNPHTQWTPPPPRH